MTDEIVELIRRFAPMSSRAREWDLLLAGTGRPQRWHEIENEHRVLIIADPGAGKTFEAQTRARRIRERGRQAFFIRIENIDANFDQAFEIGDAAQRLHRGSLVLPRFRRRSAARNAARA